MPTTDEERETASGSVRAYVERANAPMFDRRKLRAVWRAHITHALASRYHAIRTSGIVLEDKPVAIRVEHRSRTSAHRYDVHVGDITGGLGTMRRSDTDARRTCDSVS